MGMAARAAAASAPVAWRSAGSAANNLSKKPWKAAKRRGSGGAGAPTPGGPAPVSMRRNTTPKL